MLPVAYLTANSDPTHHIDLLYLRQITTSKLLAPHIQLVYYATIIATKAIGNTGLAHVAELSIDNSHIAGYAFYEGGRLVQAVLISSQVYLAT